MANKNVEKQENRMFGIGGFRDVISEGSIKKEPIIKENTIITEQLTKETTEQESLVNETVEEKTPEPAPEKPSEPTATAPVEETKEETTKNNISIDGLDKEDKTRLLQSLINEEILDELRKFNEKSQKVPKNRGRHIVTETGAEYWERDKKDFRFTIKVPASMAQKFDDICYAQGCSRNNGLENIVNGYFTKVPQVIANMPEYKPVDYILPFKNNRLNRNGRETLSVFSFCFSTSMIEAVDAECERFGFERSRFFHDCINCMIQIFGDKE